MHLRSADGDPSRYGAGYAKLRDWVYNSLDQYKPELMRILYPVFLHSYFDLIARVRDPILAAYPCWAS